MNNKYLLLLCASAVLFSSCSHVYTPAIYHQDIAYQPKPASFDKEKSATYVSLGGTTYTNNNFSDDIVSGQANISQGYVFDNFNLAYGGFVSLGDYQSGSNDTQSASYFKDKFFGVVGGRASINAYMKLDNVDFRIIGVEAAYSHEFGDYAAYRQMLQRIGGFYTDTRTNLFTLGATTEAVFHGSNNTELQHGIRGFAGSTFGYNSLDDSYYYNKETQTGRMFRKLFFKASYFIKYKKYFGTFEAGNGVFIRAGFVF